MRVRDIVFVRSNFSVGQKIKCMKLTNGDKFESVEAKIIGKYPFFALVSDNKSRWCVAWQDVECMNG